MSVAVIVTGAVCRSVVSNSGKPSPLGDRQVWRWISNAPGTTIYVRETPRQPSPDYTTVWVAYRFPSSPVSVNAQVIELWELDCRRHASRRVGGPMRGPSAPTASLRQKDATAVWRHDSAATTTGRLFAQVCAGGG
jgi:hypothetical protein